MQQAIVIGAGIGGLATAIELARAGVNVLVLEAHVYPGGCAGTFYHQGYRFDAGATLAGGFAPGAPMDRLARDWGIDWQARPATRAMQVHLPDGAVVTRWTEPQRWQGERRHWFGSEAETFWQWQEQTANALWDLALHHPAWPPQTWQDLRSLAQTGMAWLRRQPRKRWAGHLSDALRPVSVHLPPDGDRLRCFVDAQLLIAAQTTSRYANALYGSVALDLPRQGVAHIPGGMGQIATKMVELLQDLGGQVLYRQEVIRVRQEKGRPVAVETVRKKSFAADTVIFNLPPWNVAHLLGDAAPARLRRLPPRPTDGWGAFTIYAGVDQALVPADLPLHHQVVVHEPLAEGNSLFISLSPAWDEQRAPAGRRAMTISTHTRLSFWWNLLEHDRALYEKTKAEYTAQLLQAAERVLPGLQAATDLVLPGTPVSFQRFTRRMWGWVGGFPQTNLFRTWGPRLAPGLWMVGDTIFPGQSVPAVALGGRRVAQSILQTSARGALTPPVIQMARDLPAPQIPARWAGSEEKGA